MRQLKKSKLAWDLFWWTIAALGFSIGAYVLILGWARNW